MLIKDKIQLAYNVYFNSVSEDEILNAINVLNELIKNDSPNEQNRKLALGFLIKLKAKFFTIKYFDGGYLEETYSVFVRFLDDAHLLCLQNDFDNTVTMLSRLRSTLLTVHTAMNGAVDEIYLVKDEDGNPSTKSEEVLTKVYNSFISRAESLSSILTSAEIFDNGVNIFDIKEVAIKDLTDIANFCKEQLNSSSDEEINSFFNENVHALDATSTSVGFCQAFPDRLTSSASVYVLLTPIESELLYYVKCYQLKLGAIFTTINANAFMGKTAHFIGKVFSRLNSQNTSLLVFGLDSYVDENREELIKLLIEYSSSDRVCFVYSSTGKRNVYDKFYNTAVKNGFSASTVAYKYLKMPTYEEVSREFTNLGLTNGEDFDFIRNELGFMGYVGFNRAISSYTASKNWKDDALTASLQNESLSKNYLLNLPTQNLFLDVSYKNLCLDNEGAKLTEEFDYDELKSSNPKNVKKILEENLNIFEKCGLIIRYCTLCGDDVSVWPTLSTQEKSNRLTEATKLVAHLLQTEYSPEVKVVPTSEWKEKGAGGLCCDGGKLILYKEDSVSGYDWTVRAVAHEVYHAFQHTVINNGWKSWHFNELGVSKNRVPEWAYNFDNYSNVSSKTYNVEIVECDARAFENDCFEFSSDLWNTINLE